MVSLDKTKQSNGGVGVGATGALGAIGLGSGTMVAATTASD